MGDFGVARQVCGVLGGVSPASDNGPEHLCKPLRVKDDNVVGKPIFRHQVVKVDHLSRKLHMGIRVTSAAIGGEIF